MAQLVWFFDKPTIRACLLHETTDFHYDPTNGLRCSGSGPCDSSVWVDFSEEDAGDFEQARETAAEWDDEAECSCCAQTFLKRGLDDGKCDDCENHRHSCDSDDDDDEYDDDEYDDGD